MKTDQFERAMRAIGAIFGSMHAKHWLCFGGLLHLVRDGNVDADHDIDIGVFYEEYDDVQAIRAFEKYEYKLNKSIKNDVDSKYLYLGFEYVGSRGLPPVDVFAWYKHGDIRYHTYDTAHENREIPSRYIFKGVPTKFLPTVGVTAKQDPKMANLFFGPWNKPLFNMEMPVPLYMGSLLDIWYPNWLKPVAMQSISPYTIGMASCEKWNDERYVESHLKEGGVAYAAERMRLK